MNIYNTYLKVKFYNGRVQHVSIYIYSTLICNDADSVELVDRDTYYFSETTQDYTRVKSPTKTYEEILWGAD